MGLRDAKVNPRRALRLEIEGPPRYTDNPDRSSRGPDRPMPDTITERCEAKGLRMTGQRRIIEYFLSPVLQYADESIRER